MRRLIRFVLFLPSLLLVGFAVADQLVPSLHRRVTDLTGTLSVSQQTDIENTLQSFEQLKGSQVAVLIVPTTQPETIEQYSIRVASQWKLGRKSVDDGVLFLVAKNDRTLRIEVGYGLEGVLPDALCNRIIDGFVVPRFKEGDYFGGIREGVMRITKTIQGEPLPPPAKKSSGNALFIIFFFIFILISYLPRLLGGPFSRSGRGRWTSGRGGFGGWGGGGGGGFGGGGGGFGGGGASGRW